MTPDRYGDDVSLFESGDEDEASDEGLTAVTEGSSRIDELRRVLRATAATTAHDEGATSR